MFFTFVSIFSTTKNKNEYTRLKKNYSVGKNGLQNYNFPLNFCLQ